MAKAKQEKTPVNVREITPEEITLDDRNLNRHTERGKDLVNKSFSELGAGRSGLADRNGKMIAGNLSVETAIEKGLKIVEVETEGDTYLIVKRKDLDLDSTTDNRARKLALADNSTSAVSLDWDWEEMNKVEQDFGFEVGEWGVEMPGEGWEGEEDPGSSSDENSYSKKVQAPNYEPKNEKPPRNELYDKSRTEELIAAIEGAKIPAEDKEFLKQAAMRHTVFNYEKIADYYAHSDAEVQKLMEDSALVIIDFERAIELGYVKLSEEIAAQYGEEYGDEE